MVFLEITDFDKQIRADQLLRILDQEPLILDDCEAAAIEEISSYLSAKYNISLIFSAPRNALLVLYTVDVLLYHIHSRISPSTIPEMRIVRYENVIDWLRDVAKGIISPDFPILENAKQKNFIRSDPKQNFTF